VRETISEPNYTAEDLKRVQRPTLVIQGAQDRVNAPNRHAQFIAENIPYAETWIPEGVGHNVHDERLLEWVQRVLDFLRCRGDDSNEALYRLKQDRFRDERETIFGCRNRKLDGDALGVSLSNSTPKWSDRRQSLEGAGPGAVEAKRKGFTDRSNPWRWPSAGCRLARTAVIGTCQPVIRRDWRIFRKVKNIRGYG
jgi:hypothetical protein